MLTTVKCLSMLDNPRMAISHPDAASLVADGGQSESLLSIGGNEYDRKKNVSQVFPSEQWHSKLPSTQCLESQIIGYSNNEQWNWTNEAPSSLTSYATGNSMMLGDNTCCTGNSCGERINDTHEQMLPTSCRLNDGLVAHTLRNRDNDAYSMEILSHAGNDSLQMEIGQPGVIADFSNIFTEDVIAAFASTEIDKEKGKGRGDVPGETSNWMADQISSGIGFDHRYAEEIFSHSDSYPGTKVGFSKRNSSKRPLVFPEDRMSVQASPLGNNHNDC